MRKMYYSLLLMTLSIVVLSQPDSSNIRQMLQGIENSNDPGKFYLERMNYLGTVRIDNREGVKVKMKNIR